MDCLLVSLIGGATHGSLMLLGFTVPLVFSGSAFQRRVLTLSEVEITFEVIRHIEVHPAMFDLIAFDGDDTLWHNERLYQMGRDRFRCLLSKYSLQESNEEINERVNETELRNLKYYGYGVMSFVLSLIDAGIALTGGRISASDVGELLSLSKEMLSAPLELFEGAEEAIICLSASHPLMLITKGDLLHQQAKLAQSGLRSYFRHIEVVSDKSEETYAAILSRRGIPPSRFLMVGNSVRSDVLPVIVLGGWAVHIPARLSWSHEDADAPDTLRDRYFELENLGQLPGLVGTLGRNSTKFA